MLICADRCFENENHYHVTFNTHTFPRSHYVLAPFAPVKSYSHSEILISTGASGGDAEGGAIASGTNKNKQSIANNLYLLYPQWGIYL